MIEIEARLLAGDDIDAVDEAVLDQPHVVGHRAKSGTGARRQTFEIAHVGVRAFVDAHRARGGGQRLDDFVTPTIRTRRGKLQHDGVAVTIGDHARQPVRFAVNQPATAMACIQHRCARSN